MWGIKSLDAGKGLILLLLLVLLLTLIISKYSNSIMRVMVGQEVKLKTAGFEKMQSEHFDIRYMAQDSAYIEMIAQVSEEAYSSVVEKFDREPAGKTIVVVYPDTASLAGSIGWNRNESAMGVYWAGSIRILSPGEWIKDDELEKQFKQEGPMVHEFTHLMVDEITKGNYNRWWTEGIAQYFEKKITGFEFADPFTRGRELEYYELLTLEQKFDEVDQQIAYWESLQAVQYIVDIYGEEKLFAVLEEQGKGSRLNTALEISLGTSYQEFEQGFYQYLQKK